MSPSAATAGPPPGHTPGNRWATGVVATGWLLIALYATGLQLGGIRAGLAETNYQANRIRIGDYLLGARPDAAILGTSLSGRLLPEYFEGTGLRVANLGLDGAMVSTALDLALQRPDPAPVWLVETRTLLREPGPNDAQLAAIPADPSFQLARMFPILRASSRPSSILYTRLKLARDLRTGGRPGRAAAPEETSGEADEPEIDLPAATLRALDAARARGVRIVLVRLPAGERVEDSRPDPVARTVGQALGFPVLEGGRLMAEAGVEARYTDGLHLNASSARALAELLAAEIQPPVPTP